MTTDTTSARSTTSSTVTHVTPKKRDFGYNHATEHAALAVDLHFADGHTEPSVLILRPGQTELLWIQIDAAIKARARALQAEGGDEL
ncbi:hypothetical protein [Streptomyces silvisoli]|uniref:DUF397 domain-containing protein n=1 Tax=Streptomyces silvisoli TaxID=3034235 RepID=A0ABT5ZQ09_9ACTN|nr:hypothetical protein [Streptomyces silvisoli]MDF3291915.1 hypothetical protein [Streptomyces silvisoli]